MANNRTLNLRLIFPAALLASLASACSEPAGPKTVQNPNIDVKVQAIQRAVKHKDLSVAPELVKDLNNDDPAVRLYAIQGLQRLTGEQFGYQYYDDEYARKPAVLKWQQWLEQQQL